MTDFTVRTADQLPALLRAFRKQAGLTQGDVAARLGLRQQTYSAMERNTENLSTGRLMKVLAVMGVDLVLHPRADDGDAVVAGNPSAHNW